MATFKIETILRTTDDASGAVSETTHTETVVSQRSMIEVEQGQLTLLSARLDAQKAKLS
jgi:hypothetical protein